MTSPKQYVLNILQDNNIAFDIVEHKAIYTIAEMENLHLPNADAIAKNIFIRDDKKRNYYLFVVNNDKRINLKDIKNKLASRPLTFASENDLKTILGLNKGAVTPLGILNDEERKVQVFIDEVFRDTKIGVHPNENTATLWLRTKDLIAIIRQHENPVAFMAF